MVIPIFTTHFSIGDSILTLDDTSKIDRNKPVSVFAIAKTYGLDEIYLVENNFSGVIDAFEISRKNNIHLKFGLKLCVCKNLKEKDNDSLITESNVIIWALNEQGYYDLLKIYNLAATDGFYYVPRMDWENLNRLFTDNLALSFPFYSSYLAKNYLYVHNSSIVPLLTSIRNFNYLIESHNHIVDEPLNKKIRAINSVRIANTHSIYYYDSDAAKKHMIFKISHDGGNYEKPELKHFSSDEFSFTSYLERKNDVTQIQ